MVKRRQCRQAASGRQCSRTASRRKEESPPTIWARLGGDWLVPPRQVAFNGDAAQQAEPGNLPGRCLSRNCATVFTTLRQVDTQTQRQVDTQRERRLSPRNSCR